MTPQEKLIDYGKRLGPQTVPDDEEYMDVYFSHTLCELILEAKLTSKFAIFVWHVDSEGRVFPCTFDHLNVFEGKMPPDAVPLGKSIGCVKYGSMEEYEAIKALKLVETITPPTPAQIQSALKELPLYEARFLGAFRTLVYREKLFTYGREVFPDAKAMSKFEPQEAFFSHVLCEIELAKGNVPFVWEIDEDGRVFPRTYGNPAKFAYEPPFDAIPMGTSVGSVGMGKVEQYGRIKLLNLVDLDPVKALAKAAASDYFMQSPPGQFGSRA